MKLQEKLETERIKKGLNAEFEHKGFIYSAPIWSCHQGNYFWVRVRKSNSEAISILEKKKEKTRITKKTTKDIGNLILQALSQGEVVHFTKL